MRFLIAVSALALSACAAGPNYVAPIPRAAASAPFVSTAPHAASTARAIEGDWWRLYNDPVLDRLVADALKANTDIRVAVAHLERARASLREGRADRTPPGTVGGCAQ
jgi:outer membrane protein TolC